jgi:hypothetical protein
MPINIHGKNYSTVDERLSQFRSTCPDWTVKTKLISADDTRVTMKASILSPEGRLIATGHAEETRAASSINRTSAMENCETSAVGRALANLGYATDGSIASADELVKAAINEFAQAKNQEELKASYASWYRKFSGTDAEARINAAKDNRKSQLEKEA